MSLSPPRRREFARGCGGFLVLLGLALLCYFPALNGQRVWDDPSHITRPDLQSLAGLRRIWFELGATEQYYPVLHSAFWIEHRLWGDAVLGYHLVNVLLHAAAGGLLVLGLRRVGKSSPDGSAGLPPHAPFLAAAFLVVHPVAVESVAWMAEQKNTLSLVFYLLAGLTYWNFHRSGRGSTYALATGLFLLALGTKSVTSSLPAALLVVLWWKQGTLRWRPDVRPLLPWFAAAAAMGLMTAWVEHSLIGANGARFHFTAGQRLLLAGRVIWFYLGKLVWPTHLLFFYPRWDVAHDASSWWPYLAAATLVTAALFGLRRRWRGPLAAWLFYVGTLFPALGFVNVYPFLFSYVADHFQYLASVGILTAGATGMGLLLARVGPAARVAVSAAVAAALGLGVVGSWRQSREYRDGETLYRAILAGNPDSWKTHQLLGELLLARPGEAAAAQQEFRAAVALNPADGEGLNNLGHLLLAEPGGEREAEQLLIRAAAAAPYLVAPLVNLAELERREGHPAEAAAHYRAALKLDPGDAVTHNNLGNLLAGLPGAEAAAEAEFDAARQLDPANVGVALNRLALIARNPARRAEALADYRGLIQQHPELPYIHYNLAILLNGIPGREAEAVAEYQATLRLDPGLVGAYRNLGILYARAGRMDLAAAAWRQALQLDPTATDLKAQLEALERGR